MHTKISDIFRNWRCLLLLALIPALTHCTRIDGAVELNNGSGEPYSFAGAKVEVFDLNPAAVLVGQTKIPKGRGNVDDDGSTIALQVITAAIEDDALYDVEIRCAATNTTDACEVESPLHMVLSGAQLMDSGWKATVLTEIGFQNIAYSVATQYSTGEITQILDNNANALLLTATANPPAYDDLLAWNTNATDTLKRPELVGHVSESLANGISSGDARMLAQQAVSAVVSTLNLSTDAADIEAIFFKATVGAGYAYVTDDDRQTMIIDIRDPEALTLAGKFNRIGGDLMAASDGFFYSLFRESSPQVRTNFYATDVSNPQQPQSGDAGLTLGGRAYSIVAVGAYAYVGTDAGLYIVNASDVTAPILRATLNVPTLALAVAGNHAYIGNADGIHIVDISNPSAPVVVGNLATAGNATHISLIGEYAYVTVPGATAEDPVQLQVVDISDPTAPTDATQLTLAQGTSGITQVGTRAYADTLEVTQIIDISNAAAPILIATRPQDFVGGIRVNDFAFLTVNNQTVALLDTSISSQPVVQSAMLAVQDSTNNFAAAGRYAFVPNGGLDFGFKVFDLIDPLAPALLTNFNDAHFFGSMALSGNYALLIDVEYGAVRVADISNPAEPSVLDNIVLLDDGEEDLAGVRKLVLSGNRLFVPWGHDADDYYGDGIGRGEWGCTNPDARGGVGGLFAVDASAPATPTLTSHICMPEEGVAVTVNGNYAYVAVQGRLLQAVDFSNPAQPTLAGSLALAAPATSIATAGGYIWVTEGYHGIEVFDISNPAAPTLLTHIAAPGDTQSIDVRGNFAYVAAGVGGVHIFDISNPAAPQLAGNVSTDLAARTTFVAAEYLYAATGVSLEIFKMLPD